MGQICFSICFVVSRFRYVCNNISGNMSYDHDIEKLLEMQCTMCYSQSN